MRIDAHQQFWDPARLDDGGLETLAGEPARRLQRPFLPADLGPILERHGFVAGAVVWPSV